MAEYSLFPFFYNVCRKVHPKYDTIIMDYVHRTINKIGIQENHPWMREDILESPFYSCTVAGNPVSLQNMLFGPDSVNTRQNVILVIGEKHIGKYYFVKRLFKICQDKKYLRLL